MDTPAHDAAAPAQPDDGGEEMGNYYTGGRRVPGPQDAPVPGTPAGAFGAPDPDEADEADAGAASGVSDAAGAADASDGSDASGADR